MPHYTQLLGPIAVDILASVWPSSRWLADCFSKLAVRLSAILGLFGVPFKLSLIKMRCLVGGISSRCATCFDGKTAKVSEVNGNASQRCPVYISVVSVSRSLSKADTIFPPS